MLLASNSRGIPATIVLTFQRPGHPQPAPRKRPFGLGPLDLVVAILVIIGSLCSFPCLATQSVASNGFAT
jgi:hypothetical protein